jgi:hypothetical protein
LREPEIEILGAYRLPVSEELVREQFDILYGHLTSESEKKTAMQLCREQLESVVLIEAIVRNRDSKFKVDDFVQPHTDLPRENWQVAYAESYLSRDGEKVLPWRREGEILSDTVRIAFFIHFFDPKKPLYSSYGTLKCPPVQEMPERLQRLVPYQPVD